MALGEYLGAGSGTTKVLYRMNGDATDSSGNASNGTATNVTWVGGILGSGSGSFDGSSSYISIPDLAFGIANNFTFGAWIKTSYNGANIQSIIGRDNGAANPRIWQLRVDSGGAIRLVRFDSSNSLITNIASSSTFNDGKWHYVVATFDSSVGSKIYVDAVQVATDSVTTAQNNNTGLTPKIGAANTGAGSLQDYFSGNIDEVTIENVTRSLQEIRKQYTYAKGRFGII